jgi:hypothetical protein
VADLCRLTRPRSNTQGQPEAVRAAREEHSPAASANPGSEQLSTSRTRRSSSRRRYRASKTDAATVPATTIVPANEATWEDLQTVFGTRGCAVRCWCQRYKLQRKESFASFPAEERAHRFRVQTECGHPESSTTSGLVAYVDGNPVGWCAVEPRRHYSGLVRNKRVPG